MSGLERIIEDILSDARTEAEQTVGEARRKADEMLKESVRTAQAKALETVGAEQRKARSLRERAQSAVALERRKALLGAKHEVIDLVFEQICASLKEIEEEKYIRLLVRMAHDAMGGGQLVFSARDSSLAEKIVARLGADYTVSSATAEKLKSGFMLVNGKVTADCSVEAFVDGLRREYEPIIAEKLFERE